LYLIRRSDTEKSLTRTRSDLTIFAKSVAINSANCASKTPSVERQTAVENSDESIVDRSDDSSPSSSRIAIVWAPRHSRISEDGHISTDVP
jgi:hypothetical protein